MEIARKSFSNMAQIMKMLVLLVAVAAVTGNEFFDITGSGQAEWRLAFRGTAETGSSMYQAYLNGWGIPVNVEANCKQVDPSLSCSSHYRNAAVLDNWDNIAEVALVFLDSAQLSSAPKMIFNGAQSNYQNWFDKSKLTSSSWTDLDTAATTNYFSLMGESKASRRFFVNKNYGGCGVDAGWSIVIDKASPPCSWETAALGSNSYPAIKISTQNTTVNWNTAGLSTNVNALAVFVKYGVSQNFDVKGDGNNVWQLAFRGTANVGSSVYDAYKDGTGIPANVEFGCKEVNAQLPCSSHYRNAAILDNWANIEEIAFVAYRANKQVAKLFFNGTSTTYLNWFQFSGLSSSSWTDTMTTQGNYFSIEGDNPAGRRFLIHWSYNGCENDDGWFVAIDKASPPCDWELDASQTNYPVFKYSTGTTRVNWNTPGATANADFIAVFTKPAPQ